MYEVNHETFKQDVKNLGLLLIKNCERNPEYDKIILYGVPKNGLIIAQFLMILFPNEFEVLIDSENKDTIIIDDLIDSGKTLKNFPDRRHAVIYRKPHSPKVDFYVKEKDDWISFPFESEREAEDDVVRILQRIGENPSRPGLVGTPERVMRMWKEIFRGYDKSQKPKITTFMNGDDGLTYDNMITDTGNFYSHCEHHMVPFFGKYYFAYIPAPDGKILGLSKVARIVDFYAAKLQIQERLVKDIVDELWNALCDGATKPLGMALVMKGEHLCKTMRGAKKKGQMTTSYLRGVFKNELETRQEFFNLINK